MALGSFVHASKVGRPNYKMTIIQQKVFLAIRQALKHYSRHNF